MSEHDGPNGPRMSNYLQLYMQRRELIVLKERRHAHFAQVTYFNYRTHEQSASAESKKITQAKWKSFIKTKYQPPGRPKSAATTIIPISRVATSDTTDKIR